MKVTGQVLLPRETYTVHYTVKRKVCAGLKPIWLVQVWRQRYLESIVLDLRVRTYFHQYQLSLRRIENPLTLFFNITSSGPYPWPILIDQSSFIVLCHCYADRDDIKKVREIWPTNLLWHFHQKKTQDNKTSNSSNHTCHWCLYQKHHVMQRQEKDPLGQMLKASKRHLHSSPTRSHGCHSSGVCDRTPSSPSFLSRLSGSTRRKCLTAPRLPSSAAWWMSLPRDTSPTPWELLEGARLLNRDTMGYPDSYTIQDGKAWNKETIMKPPALHRVCSFSSLGMRMTKQILRRKISNA